MQKVKETADSRYICQTELDKNLPSVLNSL